MRTAILDSMNYPFPAPNKPPVIPVVVLSRQVKKHSFPRLLLGAAGEIVLVIVVMTFLIWLLFGMLH